MLTKTAFGLATLLAVAAVTPTSSGQDAYSLLNEMYGRGVHAYFSGQYDQAQRYLDAAVAHGSRDPRCYYFRGLTIARLGRSQVAEQEFQTAAQLEFSSEGTYNVARSLERIQGPDRMWLEQARQDARLAVMRQPRQQRRLVDNLSIPAEKPSSDSPDAVQPATIDVPLPPDQPDATDPFARGTQGPIGADKIEKVTSPTEEASAAGTVAGSNAEDPFGTAGAPLAPAGNEPAATADDPFASGPERAPADADDGSTAKKGKALQSLFNAFSGAIPGLGQSPSSDSQATPPAQAPAAGATTDPPAKTDDPFAQPAGADDPFGDAGQTTDDVFGQPATTGQPQASPPQAATETPPPPPAEAGSGAAGTDDPFGDVGGQPVDDVFGQPTTAAPGATPPPPTDTGAAKPSASKPTVDDPFGEVQPTDQDPFAEPATDNTPAQTKPNPQDKSTDTESTDNEASDAEAADKPGAAAATSSGTDDQQTDPFADDPDNPF